MHQVTSDTVQDLYDEIEHLIDVPFDQFQKDVKQYQVVPDHADGPDQMQQKQYEAIEGGLAAQVVPSEEAASHNKNYTFERPILIESDSDEIEEEIPFEEQYLTCYKCNKQIPSTNTLTVSSQPVTANVCIDCSSKKRSRSRSFTLNDNNVFSQLADKLKHSFGNNQLLSPGNGVDRRKSMPSMNAAFSSSSQQLEPPSPVPSRPSSRASSFIEDVKQFLAPLSRKSSRNSLYQEYQSSQLPTPEGPKRKTSHNSLLEVMNICKPKQRLSPRHQEDEAWFQEDNEVNHIHQRQQQQYQDECPLENHTSIHIPLRRKQIKQIESRQDRMNVYNNAYLECMEAPTDLVPWIIKQTQKGPPDAWFGYSPPPREPKKIMGIFKRKSKKIDGGNNLRVQQQQLGDELLSRSTPLLQSRFSNSNLSVSPGGHSFLCSDQEQDYTYSPSAINPPDEEQDDYFGSPSNHQEQQDDDYQQQPKSPNFKEQRQNTTSSTSFTEEPMPPITGKPYAVQPVSILKKSNSNRRDYMYDQYHEDEDVVLYDDDDEFDSGADYRMNRRYSASRYPELPHHRPMSAAMMDDYHHGSMMTKERRRYSGHSSPGYGMAQEPDHYYAPMPSMEPPMSKSRRRSRQRSTESFNLSDDYYYRTSTPISRTRSPYEDPYYHHQPPLMPSRSRRRSSSRYRYDLEDDVQEDKDLETTDEYYYPPKASRRMPPPPPIKTNKISKNKHSQEYYGLGNKLTPFMMEEWEIALDDLCDMFPRFDRHYINDFLRSAKGDFVIAKEMIMEMIMEIR